MAASSACGVRPHAGHAARRRCTSRWCPRRTGRRARPSSDVARTIRRRRGTTARRPSFQVWRYPETPRVGMLALSELALPGDGTRPRQRACRPVDAGLQDGGHLRAGKRDWKPHITVARFRAAPRLTPAIPGLGPSTPRRRPIQIRAQPQRLGLRAAGVNAVHGVAPLSPPRTHRPGRRPRAATRETPRGAAPVPL